MMTATGNSKTGNSELTSPGKADEHLLFRRRLRWTLGVILGLLAIYILWFAAAKIMLSGAKSRVAKAGGSLQLADYIRPEPPLEENATRYLEAGDKIMRGREREIGALSNRLKPIFAPGGKSSAEEIEFLRDQLEKYDLILRITDEAMPLEKAWFDTEYMTRSVYSIKIPNYLHRQFLMYLLKARALVAADEGRFDEAYTSAAEMFRLANWVHQEVPILIAALVGIAIENGACDTVEYLMNISPPSEDVRRRIIGEADRLSIRDDVLAALGSERVSVYAILLDEPIGETLLADEPWGAWKGSILDYPLRPYVVMDAAVAINAMTRLSEEMNHPAYEQPGTYPHDDPDLPWWAFLTKSIIPNFMAVGVLRDRALAKIDMMTIAFELEAYREEKGGYPENLDQLGGNRLIDPFSGEPYRYRKTADAYVLYSLSANRKDDGGVEPDPPTEWQEQGDLVWTVNVNQ